MTPEPTAGFTLEYTPPAEPRRRIRYEPRPDGAWMRREDVWTGCSWRPVGAESVEDVNVDGGEVYLP